MIKKYLVCFIAILSFVYADEIYFMPQESKQAIKALTQTIKESSKSIDVAIYSFTNREISKALRDTAKKGTKIRIIYDKKANKNPDKSTIGYLAKLKNVEVCTLDGELSNNKKYTGLMHLKMAIIDSKKIILGSANWSKSAFETNYENLIIMQNKEFITKAQDAFELMFKKCEKY